MEEAGYLLRCPQEMQALIDTIASEYSGNFCRVNERRVETFFNQLRADCLKLYSQNIQTIFDAAKSYFEDADLQKLHHKEKKKTFAQVH